MRFRLEPNSRVPIYQQLVDQLREAVARGAVSADTRLPSVRQLARDLVANPNTIARAYTEMERAGLVVARPGQGVFIAAPRQEMTKTARLTRLRDGIDRLLTEAVHLGFAADETLAEIEARARKFQWTRPDQDPERRLLP